MQVHVALRNAVVAALLLAPGLVSAEPAPLGPDLGLRSTLPEATAEGASLPVGPPACGTRAALYGGGGFRVWVTRKGAIRWRNPLRPLSSETLLVLQVSVNGRVASAYGPDYDHLRQGAAALELEEGNPEPIRWAAAVDELPTAIRVVAEDGAVRLGPLQFQTCGDAPRATAPRAVRQGRPVEEVKPGSVAGPTRSRQSSGRPGLPIPQGAIP